MFNEKRIDEIRKKIQISTILSDHEKSDWLNLLELMNDKQLGELEEILGVMPTTPQATPVASIKMPPLSHIANIPTDVTMTHSVPQPLQQHPQPQHLQQSSKVVQKQMPNNHQQTVPPQTLPVIQEKRQATLHQLTPRQSTSHQSTRVAQPSKPSSLPQPQESQQKSSSSPPSSSASPTQTGTAQLKKLTIGDISEIQTFDVSTLRQFELQSIVDAMRSAIEANGYFQILQQFEASPLYRSYIETGKFMLGHGTAKVADPETTLTQMELEFITDLLRHMRFNTW